MGRWLAGLHMLQAELLTVPSLLQGNFDDLVGYEEDCSPTSLPEVSGVEVPMFA